MLVAGRRVPLSGVAGTGFGGSETESAACLSARSLQREAQQPAATRPALPHPMHGEYTPLPWQNSDLFYILTLYSVTYISITRKFEAG